MGTLTESQISIIISALLRQFNAADRRAILTCIAFCVKCGGEFHYGECPEVPKEGPGRNPGEAVS